MSDYGEYDREGPFPLHVRRVGYWSRTTHSHNKDRACFFCRASLREGGAPHADISSLPGTDDDDCPGFHRGQDVCVGCARGYVEARESCKGAT